LTVARNILPPLVGVATRIVPIEGDSNRLVASVHASDFIPKLVRAIIFPV
jgi:hypothetical protein